MENKELFVGDGSQAGGYESGQRNTEPQECDLPRWSDHILSGSGVTAGRVGARNEGGFA